MKKYKLRGISKISKLHFVYGLRGSDGPKPVSERGILNWSRWTKNQDATFVKIRNSNWSKFSTYLTPTLSGSDIVYAVGMTAAQPF